MGPGKTLYVFTSHSIKEPTFDANHKKYVNPVLIKINSLDNDELKFEKPWYYLTFFSQMTTLKLRSISNLRNVRNRALVCSLIKWGLSKLKMMILMIIRKTKFV